MSHARSHVPDLPGTAWRYPRPHSVSAALDDKEITMQTLNAGNNEQISRGLIETDDGFLALAFSQSKTFKTRNAAIRWLSKRGVIVK